MTFRGICCEEEQSRCMTDSPHGCVNHVSPFGQYDLIPNILWEIVLQLCFKDEEMESDGVVPFSTLKTRDGRPISSKYKVKAQTHSASTMTLFFWS